MKLLAVIERDIKKFRRNPLVLGMSFMLPIIYLVILGNSFQGKLTALPVAVVDLDPGPHSTTLMDNLRAIEAGPRTISIYRMKDEKLALQGVQGGDFKAALIIPSDFSTSVSLNRVPEVGLFLDNTDAVSAEAVTNSIKGALRTLGREYVPLRDVPGETQLRDVLLYRKVDYFQSLVPGIVIMGIFLGTLTTGAFNLVMDRFLGIEESYLLTPLSKFDIVAGLIISGLSLTTITASVILVLSMLITGIPLEGGLRQFLLSLLVIVLTTIGLLSMMFTIMGRLGHPRIVGILSGFLNVILFFPSGAVYPVASFPGWLRAFSRVNPETYSVHALKAILFKGAAIGTVWPDLAYLAGFTAIMLTVSVTTFKRTL